MRRFLLLQEAKLVEVPYPTTWGRNARWWRQLWTMTPRLLFPSSEKRHCIPKACLSAWYLVQGLTSNGVISKLNVLTVFRCSYIISKLISVSLLQKYTFPSWQLTLWSPHAIVAIFSLATLYDVLRKSMCRQKLPLLRGSSFSAAFSHQASMRSLHPVKSVLVGVFVIAVSAQTKHQPLFFFSWLCWKNEWVAWQKSSYPLWKISLGVIWWHRDLFSDMMRVKT